MPRLVAAALAAALILGIGRADAQNIGALVATTPTISVVIKGAGRYGIGTKLSSLTDATASRTFLNTDSGQTVKRTYGSGAMTDTLPNVFASGFGLGFSISVCNATSSTDTISSSSTINGAGSISVAANTCASIADLDGTNYSAFGPGITSLTLTVPSWLQVTGSPLSPPGGTLAIGGALQSANLFLASPSGGSGILAPRAIVNADLPTRIPVALGWIAGQNPNNAVLFTASPGGAGYTITAIVGRVEIANGAIATVTVNSAPSGTLCSGGTAVSSALNANGSAATNQTLTSGTPALAAGSSLCVQTTGGANWTSGSAVGGITVYLKPL